MLYASFQNKTHDLKTLVRMQPDGAAPLTPCMCPIKEIGVRKCFFSLINYRSLFKNSTAVELPVNLLFTTKDFQFHDLEIWNRKLWLEEISSKKKSANRLTKFSAFKKRLIMIKFDDFITHP